MSQLGTGEGQEWNGQPTSKRLKRAQKFAARRQRRNERAALAIEVQQLRATLMNVGMDVGLSASDVYAEMARLKALQETDQLRRKLFLAHVNLGKSTNDAHQELARLRHLYKQYERDKATVDVLRAKAAKKPSVSDQGAFVVAYLNGSFVRSSTGIREPRIFVSRHEAASLARRLGGTYYDASDIAVIGRGSLPDGATERSYKENFDTIDISFTGGAFDSNRRRH